jgi:hypothetical protein
MTEENTVEYYTKKIEKKNGFQMRKTTHLRFLENCCTKWIKTEITGTCRREQKVTRIC